MNQKLKNIIIAFSLIVVSSISQAQDDSYYDLTGKFAGQYLCSDEAVGGIIYKNNSQEWIGGNFKSDTQYIVKILDGDIFGEGDYRGTRYFVRIVVHGGDTEINDLSAKCFPTGGQEGLRIGKNGRFECRRLLTRWNFNLDLNKYLSTYVGGYIYEDADQPGSDTPFIAGGRCTKL